MSLITLAAGYALATFVPVPVMSRIIYDGWAKLAAYVQSKARTGA